MDTTSSLSRPAFTVGGLKLTKHARVRMIERQIDDAELVATLTEADTTRVISSRGITVFGHNGVAVVLNRAMTKVLTVLPRGAAPARWRGNNEGLRGYRRDPSNPGTAVRDGPGPERPSGGGSSDRWFGSGPGPDRARAGIGCVALAQGLIGRWGRNS
jgi:hypothetical protein